MAYRTAMALSISLLLVESALSQDLQTITLGEDLTFSAGSIVGPSRKIMRLSDGSIHASFVGDPGSGNQIKLFSSTLNRSGWDDVGGRQLAEVKARSVNSDTGPSGTYVSFVNGRDNVGEILLFPDPTNSPGKFIRYDTLTAESADLTDGFIAASKGDESINTVAYAWRDQAANTLLVGFSPDGRSFPDARLLVKDPHLRSGPQLAVHNNYVMVSYLSSDPALQPRGASAAAAYPVFTESWDGGQTWSAPRSVLGTELTRFPKVDYAHIGAAATDVDGNLLAGGGALQPSNSLAWAQPGIGARIFVLTGQTLVSSDPAIAERLQAHPQQVAILSFKDLSDGPDGPWTSVVASVPPKQGTLGDVPAASDFQYSALPGTSIRAVAYRRSGLGKQAQSQEGIEVAISTNTGQSFDLSVFVAKTGLGLAAADPLIFTTSPCVSKNDNGDLFLDVAYLGESNKITTAQLPLNYNLSQLPPSMFNVAAKWP